VTQSLAQRKRRKGQELTWMPEAMKKILRGTIDAEGNEEKYLVVEPHLATGMLMFVNFLSAN
jgi:hypothetical protein